MSRSAGARLLRDWRQWTALVLLAVVAVAGFGIRSDGDRALAAAGRAHWSGAYDLVVTSTKNTVGLGDGLVAPDQLTRLTTGLTEKQLRRVRAIPGVDVAAPLGVLTVSADQQTVSGLTVVLPRDSSVVTGTAVAPQGYTLRTVYTADDGTGERTVADITEPIVIDASKSAAPSAYGTKTPCQVQTSIETVVTLDHDPAYPLLCAQSLTDVQVDQVVQQTDSSGFASGPTGAYQESGVYELSTGMSPYRVGESQRVTLVDPAAERKLLGAAGSFLDPLVQLAPTATTTPQTVAAWTQKQPPSDDPVRAGIARFAAYQNEVDAFASTQTDVSNDDSASYSDQSQGPAIGQFTTGSDTTDPTPITVPVLYDPGSAVQLSARLTATPYGPISPGRAATDSNGNDGFAYGFSPGTMTPKAPGTTVTTSATGLMVPLIPGSEPLAAWPGTRAKLPAADIAALGIDQGSAGGGVASYTMGGTAAHPTATEHAVRFDMETLEADEGSGSTETAAPGAQQAPLGAQSGYLTTPAQTFDPSDDSQQAEPIAVASLSQQTMAKAATGDAPLGAYEPVSNRLTTKSGSITIGDSGYGDGPTAVRTTAIASLGSASAWLAKAPIGSIRVRVAHSDGYDAAGRARVEQIARAVDALPGLKATVVVGSSKVPVDVSIAGFALPQTTADDAHQKVATVGTATQTWTRLGTAATASFEVPAWRYVAWWVALLAALLLFVAVPLLSPVGGRDGEGASVIARAPLLRSGAGHAEGIDGFAVRQAIARLLRWLPVLVAAAVTGAAAVVLVRVLRVIGTGSADAVFAAAGLVAAVLLLVLAVLAVLRAGRRQQDALVEAGWSPRERVRVLAVECALAAGAALIVAAIAAAATLQWIGG